MKHSTKTFNQATKAIKQGHHSLSTASSPQKRIHDWLADYILPAGLLALMTGMFWVGDRSLYHKVYYTLLAFPTLIALILSPTLLAQTSKNGILMCFLLFATYTAISISWSGNIQPSSIKRPIYIALLFYATILITQKNPNRLEKIIYYSLWIATISAIISITKYFYTNYGGRFSGYGALYNPLLTSHVYGMFAALALALSLQPGRSPWLPLGLFAILSALLLLTGSRTPLTGLGACLLWQGLINRNMRILWIISGSLTGITALFLIDPENLVSRGFSHRPQIWAEAWRQILQNPWFGHGYEYPFVCVIPELDFTIADPHNIELAVLFSGGIVGLMLWLLLYGVALCFAWRNRHDQLVALASTALIFGITAGLTEGSAFMSRPKEHWFLIWIPMALLAAAWLRKKPGKS